MQKLYLKLRLVNWIVNLDLLNLIFEFCKNSKKFKNIKIKAVSVHIGSQITSIGPYKKTLDFLLKMIKSTGISFEFVDLGGGFGIPIIRMTK